MAETQRMSLKLLVDKESSVVLFAEAGKDFVDFLLCLFHLPLGAVARLLKQNEKGMPGSLGSLYESIQGMSNSYILPDVSKEAVLCPKVMLSSDDMLMLKSDGVNSMDDKMYRCSRNCANGNHLLSKRENVKCPYCSQDMNVVVNPFAAANTGGYVQGIVTYMVMDDLVVKPMSSISSIALLNTYNIKDVGVLEEKTVSLGFSEGLELLRASLKSKTVLTDVFLRGL